MTTMSTATTMQQVAAKQPMVETKCFLAELASDVSEAFLLQIMESNRALAFLVFFLRRGSGLFRNRVALA